MDRGGLPSSVFDTEHVPVFAKASVERELQWVKWTHQDRSEGRAANDVREVESAKYHYAVRNGSRDASAR